MHALQIGTGKARTIESDLRLTEFSIDSFGYQKVKTFLYLVSIAAKSKMFEKSDSRRKLALIPYLKKMSRVRYIYQNTSL